MGELPIIRLEIEGMKHTIMQYLSKYHMEIEDIVSQEIDQALEGIDLRAKVRAEIADCVNRSIESYFRRGDGAKVVEAAVWESLTGNMENVLPEDKLARDS